MRHRKRKHKLGVSSSHRIALLANLSIALITHGRIRTTLAKAKALRPFVEKIITLAKKAHFAEEGARKLHFRRLAISRLNNPEAVAKLFDERVEEFLERPGGYTRIYKLGQRIGDAAEMALIELIDADDEGYAKRSSKKNKKSKKADESKASTEDEVVEVEAADSSTDEASEDSESQEVDSSVDEETSEDVESSEDDTTSVVDDTDSSEEESSEDSEEAVEASEGEASDKEGEK